MIARRPRLVFPFHPFTPRSVSQIKPSCLDLSYAESGPGPGLEYVNRRPERKSKSKKSKKAGAKMRESEKETFKGAMIISPRHL